MPLERDHKGKLCNFSISNGDMLGRRSSEEAWTDGTDFGHVIGAF
jgi:hypothetical protein